MKKAVVLIICSIILFCGCATLNQNTSFSSASSIAGIADDGLIVLTVGMVAKGAVMLAS